jgi:hypothetical protein
MADLRISQLPEITTTLDADVLPIVDQGATSKIQIGNMKASSADIVTGTETQKWATPKALKDAGIVAGGGTNFLVVQIFT